jgi:hypothetical protein
MRQVPSLTVPAAQVASFTADRGLPPDLTIDHPTMDRLTIFIEPLKPNLLAFLLDECSPTPTSMAPPWVAAWIDIELDTGSIVRTSTST